MLVHHDARSYETAAAEAAAHWRPKMEEKIEEGRKSAAALLDHVMTNVPQDFLPSGHMLEFKPQNKTLQVVAKNMDAIAHPHAIGQIASKAGVHTKYLSDLIMGEDGSWQPDLAAEILNQTFKNASDLAESRHLCRVVGGKLKGFLSNRFRRLDDRPLVEAFIESIQKYDAVPIEGSVCETRVALKAALPYLFEPVKNEIMMVYMQWGNSNFGSAKHSCGLGVWRLWCTNKAMMDDGLSTIHLGRELTDDIEFSTRTYELDTRTQVSALKDVVTNYLAPNKVNALMAAIRSASEKEIEWKSLKTKLDKALLKGEMKMAEDAFYSDDDINLPPVKSMWRASNAISWLAGKTADAERKLQLERIAGQLLSGVS